MPFLRISSSWVPISAMRPSLRTAIVSAFCGAQGVRRDWVSLLDQRNARSAINVDDRNCWYEAI